MSRVFWLALAVCGAAACGPPPGAQVKTEVQTMSREQSPDKLVERGKAFAAIGDLTRAEQYLASALDQGAEPRTVLPLLLKVCVEARRYRGAIDYAEGHLKKRPQDVHLRVLLGNLYVAVEDIPRARAQFELVLQTNPNHAEVHYGLAVLLRDHQQDLVQADLHFREYLRLSPKGPHADEARGSLLKSVP